MHANDEISRWVEAGRAAVEYFGKNHYFTSPRFATETRIDAEKEDIVADLIVDVLHYMRQEGVDIKNLLQRCETHLNSEVKEQANEL